MPAFLTHWWVLIETARRSQDAGSDLGSLILDPAAIQRRLKGLSTPPPSTPAGAIWDTGPLPEINLRFPGSDISAMAFLGALAPDVTSYQRLAFAHKVSGSAAKTKGGINWAKLLHANRSGDVLLGLLEQIAEIPSPALRSLALAFAMGYLSHVATDIALNPYINALSAAYTPHDLPGLFNPLGTHFYAELCLDEYVAATRFERDLYGWTLQPWGQYIEPVARMMMAHSTVSLVLDQLVSVVERIYGLTQEQRTLFRAHFLAGLQGAQHYLAGRSPFRWLTLNTRLRRKADDPLIATMTHPCASGYVSVEEVLSYAIRLSEHLCRRAISYYASLRNSSVSASERAQRCATLREDLRNWDLGSGYCIEVSFDQEITVRFLHNWIHFATLWEDET